MRVTLLCHAATAATRAAQFPADEPVEPRTLARLAGRPPRLPSVGRCLTSPAARARQTAGALGLSASTDPALRDLDCGRWAGRTLDAVQAAEPAAVAAWLGDPAAAPHGGEAIAGLLARVGGWLDGLGLEGGLGPVLAVTHAAVVRAAIVHALGAEAAVFWRIDVAPLAVAALGGGPGRWTLGALRPG